jgi:hypothetical protein
MVKRIGFHLIYFWVPKKPSENVRVCNLKKKKCVEQTKKHRPRNIFLFLCFVGWLAIVYLQALAPSNFF